jgi:hypothetical protein
VTEIFDDINKLYQFSAPQGALAPFIEFFSESLNEDNVTPADCQPFSVKLFPSWTPTIWINLGPAYELQTARRTVRVRQDDDVLILRDGIVTRYNRAADHIFTIKFYPGGLGAILGLRQPSLINKIIKAADIIPAALIQRIKQQDGFAARRHLLENFFRVQLQKQQPADHYRKLVTDSIDFYCGTAMKYNTSQVAEKMFVTSKTINRYFHHIIGISPKKYFSIIRARKALTLHKADKNGFDPSMHGYYDMSHFYKETAGFTGQRNIGK